MKTLKSINPNKATGPDDIPNKVLKMAAEILSPSLSAIFNRSLSMGIYPNDWKMARVLPIFKSGDKDDIDLLTDIDLYTIDLYQLSLQLPKFLAGLFMTSFTPIYHPIN